MAARGSKRSGPAAGGSGRVRPSAPVSGSEAPPAEEKSEPPQSSSPPGPKADRRLESILRALPLKDLDGLIERIGLRVDPQKRIDKPAQVARALVRSPDVREPARLPGPSAELLRRIAEAGGSLVVGSLPSGLELLVRRGIVFARVADDALATRYRESLGSEGQSRRARAKPETIIELVLPTALLVQMKSGEGEDPRSLRALLAEAPFETASAIASHYLGRPSTPPIALSLEPAWEVLGERELLLAEIHRISHQERRLLDQLEEVGGEVDTQELMDLEREPMRVRGAYGVAAGRRGAAFSLEKRGLLFPLHPNRYVVPSEVAAVIGADRRRAHEARRERIRSHVVAEDHLPRRARFSADPAPYALALSMCVRDGGGAILGEVKGGVGTPRSLISRLAQRFGRNPDETALLIALSRAVGLWEPTAVSPASPPGSLRLYELSRLLFDTWRRGGAWDEARSEPEMLRVPQEHRDPSPVGVLREIVLDSLCDLSEGQWVPYRELIAYLSEDPRVGGLRRLLERWAKRVGVATPSEQAVARRMLLESLTALGAIDLGGAGPSADRPAAAEQDEAVTASLAIRLTARGRELIDMGTHAEPDCGEPMRGTASENHDRRLRLGTSARVAEVIELGPFVDLTAIEPVLELELSSAALARGLGQGVEAGEMQRRLELLVTLGEPLLRSLTEAGTVIGKGTLVGAGAFLWIDDPDVREMLRSRQATADMFVDPSPAGGLLVAPHVDPERVLRRCRALGVDVSAEEGFVRVRRSTIPPAATARGPATAGPGETQRKALSWRPPAIGTPPPRGSAES